MVTEIDLQNAQTLLAPWTEHSAAPDPARLDVYMPPENLVEATRALIVDGWYLSAVTGIDMPEKDAPDGAVEVLYHFCKGAAVVTLRLTLPYDLPEVPTVCGVIPSATLYERELMEMFGVIVVDTPVRAKLLLPDDWPDFIYPLRKSFKGLDQD